MTHGVSDRGQDHRGDDPRPAAPSEPLVEHGRARPAQSEDGDGQAEQVAHLVTPGAAAERERGGESQRPTRERAGSRDVRPQRDEEQQARGEDDGGGQRQRRRAPARR